MKKPDLDTSEYKSLILHNKLQVLLVSDSSTSLSSACLDIKVGSMHDPIDTQGLAHFCEHLLFMGTKKYPLENEYSSYLSNHGGSSNAFTSTENTNYYFEVSSDAFEGALDRFAQFFIDPLFDDSCTERELLAVDSEHKKNIHQDNWRFHQLEKDLCEPSHPYNKFGTGNLSTLKDAPISKGQNIRNILLDFHSKYYSANIMKLIVLGKESLDQLENWVSLMFSSIRNINVSIPVFPGHPLSASKLSKLTIMKPVKDWKYIELSFPFPDTTHLYQENTSKYIAHLIGHEGDGSILSFLKRKGLALELSAGLSHGGSGFGFFKVSVQLTDLGLKQYQSVVLAIFQYIKMMQNAGVLEWIFKECQSLGELQFRFKEKISPSKFTSRVASQMHLYPPEDVLSGPYLISKFNPELIKEHLALLNPANFKIVLVSNEISTKTWSKAAYYGTEYYVTDFPEDLVNSLNNLKLDDELHLPVANIFIPTNFDVVKNTPTLDLADPYIVKDTEFGRFWYKRDDKFFVPKANCWLLITTPVAYASPLNSILTKLYCELVVDDLNETSYYAECAGLSFSLESTTEGLLFHISGYNDKLPILLDTVLKRMKSINFSLNRFLAIKEQTTRELVNFQMENPYYRASYYISQFTQEKMWSVDDKLLAIADVTLTDLENFQIVLFQNVFTESFIHGNINLEEAHKIITIIENSLVTRPVALSQRFTFNRTHIIPENKPFVYVREDSNSENINSAIEFYLQVGDNHDLEIRSKLSLFHQILSEPVFDQLRTKEQLGYIVFSDVRKQIRMSGYRIIIQSESDSQFLEERIEVFLESVKSKLESITLTEFDQHKKALDSKLREKSKNLLQESNKLWTQIRGGTYEFSYREREAEAVQSLQLADIISFYNKRKLSMHLRSLNHKNKNEEILGNVIVIGDDLHTAKLGLEIGRGSVPFKPIEEFKK